MAAPSHDMTLISTISVGISLAFVAGLIASKLRLSPIVGYLLAGIAVGPFTPGFTADFKLAEQLSEIGIILLMFGVGLHFSIKDLMAVRKIAVPGALVQVGTATVLGAALAHYLGFSIGGSLIFGLALSVASTVVLIRALEERGAISSTNGKIAVGWLIVEDIIMILALVLIPVLALSFGIAEGGGAIENTEEGGTAAWLIPLLITFAKIGLFVVFMMVIGVRFLPWILGVVVRTGSRELFTLAVFTVAVGVAFGSAALFGVSLALGAFFAGMMLKESELCHAVAERALPFQDAFAVLFFVAVGMLFNPMIVLERPLEVVAIVAIIVVGKSVAAFAIVKAFRYPTSAALLISASLAQIGEFSFILAGLGRLYGVLPEEGFSLILAGALVSITINPFLFQLIPNMRETLTAKAKVENAKKTVQPKPETAGEVMIIGAGRLGNYIAEKLIKRDIHPFLLDQNSERVQPFIEQGEKGMIANAFLPGVLEQAGIKNIDTLIIAITNPFETRQIIEESLRLNPNLRVMATANNEEELAYFEKVGVEAAFSGEREIARTIAEKV